ncbi:hypothetical protein AOLI_G00099390 [Acnodon oligacanthus]
MLSHLTPIEQRVGNRGVSSGSCAALGEDFEGRRGECWGYPCLSSWEKECSWIRNPHKESSSLKIFIVGAQEEALLQGNKTRRQVPKRLCVHPRLAQNARRVIKTN